MLLKVLKFTKTCILIRFNKQNYFLSFMNCCWLFLKNIKPRLVLHLNLNWTSYKLRHEWKLMHSTHQPVVFVNTDDFSNNCQEISTDIQFNLK